MSDLYIKQAMVTEFTDTKPIISRLEDKETLRLLHVSLGLVTEASEFADVLKKYIYYGKPIDHVNLAEEIGDLFWYIAEACSTLGVSFESVMDTNINKLRKRYKDKFTENNAVERNVGAEREVLEASIGDSLDN